MKSLHIIKFSVPTLKSCALYLAISCVTGLHGQNLKRFTSKENAKIDSVVKSFQSKDKLKVLSLLPNISYNLETGFSVGFSLNNFIQFSQTKKRNKIELIKLKSMLVEKLDKKLDKAELAKEKIDILKDEIALNVSVLKHRYDLYKIAFMEYNNNEVTFSSYTLKKISYLEKYNAVISKINRLKILLLKYNQDYNIILFDADNLILKTKNYEIAN